MQYKNMALVPESRGKARLSMAPSDIRQSIAVMESSCANFLLWLSNHTNPGPPPFQGISIGFNSFTGTLPASWSRLVRLKFLYLPENQLYGTIPVSAWRSRKCIGRCAGAVAAVVHQCRVCHSGG